ncbi:hypothetical protein [Spirillospora sp. NBC_01491]|uniref:hypothetical protein n=1 Tax=Spirillospora sp. NBC_01491 TaxID=2976007 RepID=UPI002E308B51|nr:hypothetical protein [Spirillospora sp. NBC_01491]
MTHRYLSTACQHEADDGNPELHGSCRQTCKWCNASCMCRRHPAADAAAHPPHWLDQARGVALRLYGHLQARGVDLDDVDPHLARAFREDPAMFWVRGEVLPPGEWRPDTPEETS